MITTHYSFVNIKFSPQIDADLCRTHALYWTSESKMHSEAYTEPPF